MRIGRSGSKDQSGAKVPVPAGYPDQAFPYPQQGQNGQYRDQSPQQHLAYDAPTPPSGARSRMMQAPPQGGAQPLGQFLLGAGVLRPAQLAAALRDQESGNTKRIGTLLIELGVIRERELIEALSAQSGLPLADLSHRALSPDAATLLPEAVARGLGAIALASPDPNLVDIAISDPAIKDDVRRAVGRQARILLASPAEIARALDQTYRALVDVDQHVAAFVATQDTRSAVQRPDLETATEDAPVVRVVSMIITQALRDRSSDVHIEPQDTRVRVRFRIDGALHELLSLPAEMSSAIASRIKIMAGMNIVERRRPQDGQIAMTVDDRKVDIRVATTGTIWGEKVVLRILDKSRPLYKLSDLGMPPETHEAYSRMIRSPYGMVICAGPTGSGKTTSLYASMSEVNGPDKNITTIEDPVEYVFPSINQIQINEAAGITFAGGLKAILRQDPDMILVGEMRDAETARIAVQSALTGHFVLSSLHATDSVSALYRFLDMGIEAFLIASSVIGVVAQRLIRRTCQYCRVQYQPSADELAFFYDRTDSQKTDFWAGAGCNYCSGTGYSDRVGVYELLTVTEEMRELVVKPNPSHEDMRRLAIAQGMRTLGAEGVRLVEQDTTTISEIVRSIYTI